MGRLDGKVAVITGAGGGMGADAAVLFSEEGAQVCVADVNLEAAEQVAAQARDAFAVQVDVASGDSVQAMYAATAERFGGIDVLYNNAGISPADDDSSLARKSAPFTISRGFASRPIGQWIRRRSSAAGSSPKIRSSSGVSTGPGQSALTRIPCRANWTASSRLRARTAPFEAV